MSEWKVPDDRKSRYKLQQQIPRSFRNDEDAVAIAKRTIEHIERIAALEAENAVERSNVRRWQDSSNANRDEAMLQQDRAVKAEAVNAQLRLQNAALKAPVSDEEWTENERTAVNNRGIVDAMTQKQVDALIAARAKETP